MSLSNKFAAVALAVTETAQVAVDELTPSAVAALITIVNCPPLSIGEIARAIGLTHSATVRLIDRLEHEGLVRRQRRVGREVAVEATARGRRRVATIHDARERAVNGFLDGLETDERETLGGLLDKILVHAVEGGANRERLCRMCRRADCDCRLGAAESDEVGIGAPSAAG